MGAFRACRCIVVFNCISIWHVGCLGSLWTRCMRYVERIAVVACGPLLVFVIVCWRFKRILLFVVAAVVCVNLRMFVFGFRCC